MPTDHDRPRRDLPGRTFEFARRIIELSQELDQTPGTSRTLADLLLRAGTAIGAHTEEAHTGPSRPDFLGHITHACQQARETQYWLRLLTATHLLPPHRLTDITDESTQLVAILTTIVKNTRTTP